MKNTNDINDLQLNHDNALDAFYNPEFYTEEQLEVMCERGLLVSEKGVIKLPLGL